MTNIVTSYLTLTCPHCGGNQFIQPADANLESKVTCSGCKGVFLTSDLADVATRKEAVRLATEATRAAFGKFLK
jgi:ribosomal protein S27E